MPAEGSTEQPTTELDSDGFRRGDDTVFAVAPVRRTASAGTTGSTRIRGGRSEFGGPAARAVAPRSRRSGVRGGVRGCQPFGTVSWKVVPAER